MNLALKIRAVAPVVPAALVFLLALGLSVSTVLVAPACDGLGSVTEPVGVVHTHAIAGVVDAVADRTAAYVDADPGLADAQRAQIMDDVRVLRETLTGDTIPAYVLGRASAPVLPIHDAYVSADPLLSPNGKAIRLEDSARIRAVARQARAFVR